MAKKFGWGLMVPGLLFVLWLQLFSNHSLPWWAFISVALLATLGVSVGLLTQSDSARRSD